MSNIHYEKRLELALVVKYYNCKKLAKMIHFYNLERSKLILERFNR